ncbi:MAG: hypothetical protein J6Q53_04340 [Oscillospiraceae bacterium]|nr:hypothetical protein [Oscillospiraceae bacterium]
MKVNVNLVNVQFRDKKCGEFTGREFSYIADVPLQKGDVVSVPTRYGPRHGCISRVGVPVSELQCRVGELRHITESATPGDNLLKGFFD